MARAMLPQCKIVIAWWKQACAILDNTKLPHAIACPNIMPFFHLLARSFFVFLCFFFVYVFILFSLFRFFCVFFSRFLVLLGIFFTVGFVLYAHTHIRGANTHARLTRGASTASAYVARARCASFIKRIPHIFQIFIRQ